MMSMTLMCKSLIYYHAILVHKSIACQQALGGMEVERQVSMIINIGEIKNK